MFASACARVRACVRAKQSIYSRQRGHLHSFYHFQSASPLCRLSTRRGALLLRLILTDCGSDCLLLMNRVYLVGGAARNRVFFSLCSFLRHRPVQNTSNFRRAPEFTAVAASSEFSQAVKVPFVKVLSEQSVKECACVCVCVCAQALFPHHLPSATHPAAVWSIRGAMPAAAHQYVSHSDNSAFDQCGKRLLFHVVKTGWLFFEVY